MCLLCFFFFEGITTIFVHFSVQSPSPGLLKRKLTIEKIEHPKPNPQIQNTKTNPKS